MSQNQLLNISDSGTDTEFHFPDLRSQRPIRAKFLTKFLTKFKPFLDHFINVRMSQRPTGKSRDQGQNPDLFRTILALWSAIPDLSGPTVHVTSPVLRLYLDYKNILAFSLPCSGPPPPLPSNAPQPPWQWSPSPFQILGFYDIEQYFSALLDLLQHF